MAFDNRLAEIQNFFDELVNLNPEDREKQLQKLSTTFNELKSEVAALLKAHDRSPSLLEKPAFYLENEPFKEIDYSGQTIGAYRIVRQIGSGGMGMVFLAERSDGQYEKQVALKLIRRGLDSRELVQRFLNERQALASLNHPGIARFLEGSLTNAGLPYIVMEYVEGVPITEYCKGKKLNINQRLQLFRKVCAAVEHLHQNLIVHRDLKPANILVTPEGNPVLLDFGIVKLLNTQLSTTSETLTQAGMWLMTPEYASPEQVCGKTITVTSDVYSLGVLLYELLTGVRPHRFKSRLPQEIEHVICEVEPMLPSTAAKSEAPENLTRRLKGDLNAIMLKALRKEPTQRYLSVQNFSDDISRNLQGTPVAAQKNTVLYRSKKYVRRNWIGLSIAGTFLLLIGLFVFSTSRQATRVARERDKAEQVSTFLIDLFEISTPEKALGDTISARQILDQGAKKIRRELSTQPEVQATMMAVIGQVYRKLGIYDTSDSLLSQSLLIRKKTYQAPHSEIADGLFEYALFKLQTGKYRKADSLAQLAHEMYLDIFGKKHIKVADCIELNGLINSNSKDLNLGIELLNKALQMKIEILGRNRIEIAETYQSLGYTYMARSQPQLAEDAFRAGFKISSGLLNENDPFNLNFLQAIAYAANHGGRPDEAENIMRQVIPQKKAIYGENHIAVGTAMSVLSAAYYQQNKYAASESLDYKILEIDTKIYGREHPATMIILNNIAAKLNLQNRFQESARIYEEIIRGTRKKFSKQHPRLFHYLSNLTLAYLCSDQINLAKQECKELLELKPIIIEQEPSRVGYFNSLYSQVLLSDAKYKEAERTILEGIELYQKVYKNPEHLVYQDARSILGECLTAQGRYAEAESLLIKSYPVIEKKRGKTNRYTTKALDRIINLYRVWGKPEEAAEYEQMLPDIEEPKL